MAPQTESERSDLKRKRDDGARQSSASSSKRARSSSERPNVTANGVNGHSTAATSKSPTPQTSKHVQSQQRKPSQSPSRRRRSSGSVSMSNAQRKQIQTDLKNGNTPENASKAKPNAGEKARRGSETKPSDISKNKLRKLKKPDGSALAETPEQKAERKQRKRDKDEKKKVDKAERKKEREEEEKKKKERKSIKKASVIPQRDLSWRLADPIGGRLIDFAAAFSGDEMNVLFATDHCIRSGSTDKSIIQHEFLAEASGDITAYAPSQQDPDLVYVGTRKGYIISWNFKTGQLQGRWMIGSAVWSIVCRKLPSMSQETVFTVDQSQSNWHITAHRFGVDGDLSQTSLATLLKYKRPVHSLRIIGDCEGIAALTPTGLILGRLQSGPSQKLKKLAYSWREIPCNEPPTCLDAQLSHREPGETGPTEFDIVFGTLTGALHVYRKVLGKVGMGMSKEASKHLTESQAAPSNVLHWHREAVGAVAFSRDGEYIISGGRETVLILWQLDTGSKRFLPHLESPVVTLNVSPSGALYAIGLADNSVMVLSTAEMKPVANFAGLQTSCTSKTPSSQMIMATRELVDQISNNTSPASIQATIDPSDPDILQCAVPAAQSIRNEKFAREDPRPYLQTYSIGGSAEAGHIARQSLARTNATSTNFGPEGNHLREPDVTYLATSHNGRWLASVDEWKPPKHDLEEFVTGSADVPQELEHQRVVTLRFWERNADSKTWELNTRIDAPHTVEGSRDSGRILALTSCNNGSTFATVGDDNKARLWCPKTQAPDSRIFWGESLPASTIQAASKRGRTWFAARHVIDLDSPGRESHAGATHAAIAASNDGSLLAVHMHQPTVTKHLVATQPRDQGAADSRAAEAEPQAQADSPSALLHFIDIDFGKVRELRSDLCPDSSLATSESTPYPPSQPPGSIHALSFIGPRLIVLSARAVFLWDITSFALLSSSPIPPARDPSSPKSALSRAPPPLLAVNAATNTYALAHAVQMPGSERVQGQADLPPHAHRDYTSRVAVFDVPSSPLSRAPTPRFAVTTPRLVLALLDAAGGSLAAALSGRGAATSSSVTKHTDSRRGADAAADARSVAHRVQSRGFHLLDCAATVRSVRAPLLVSSSASADASSRAALAAEDMAVEEDSDDDDGDAESDQEDADNVNEKDARTALVRAHAASMARRRGNQTDESGNADGGSGASEAEAEAEADAGAQAQANSGRGKGEQTQGEGTQPRRRRFGDVVVTPEQLAGVLEADGTTHAMPSVREMFQGVVRLFAGVEENVQ